MLEWKVVQMFQVAWPRWLPGLYRVKTFENLLIWNLAADYLETWYTGLSTRVLPNLFRWWHWVDLDHFYDMVNLFPNASAWVKVDLDHFMESLNSPMHSKRFQKSSSWGQYSWQSWGLVSWVLISLFKWWPLIDLCWDFYGNVRFMFIYYAIMILSWSLNTLCKELNLFFSKGITLNGTVNIYIVPEIHIFQLTWAFRI